MNNKNTNTIIGVKKKALKSSKKAAKTSLKKRVVVSSKPRAVVLSKPRVIPGSNIQYVLPLGNGWVIKSSNSTKFYLITDSKKEAISIARKLARNKHTELVVHGKNGNIEVKESYTLK